MAALVVLRCGPTVRSLLVSVLRRIFRVRALQRLPSYTRTEYVSCCSTPATVMFGSVSGPPTNMSSRLNDCRNEKVSATMIRSPVVCRFGVLVSLLGSRGGARRCRCNDLYALEVVMMA